MANETQKIGFIGSGNIVQALIGGILKAGTVQPSQILTSAPSDRNFSKIQAFNVATTHNNAEVASFADILFLACKPYQVQSVVSKIRLEIKDDALIVSCAAALPMADLENYFQSGNCPRIIRMIPNTACMVQAGSMVVVRGTQATETDMETLKALFKGVGRFFEVPERLMEPSSGIIGCGVAYVAMIAEAFADGGVMVGIPRRDAMDMAAQLLIGTGKLLQETGKHPGEIKDAVCSPNGTSIRGVHALERGGLRASIINAVEATVVHANALAPK